MSDHDLTEGFNSMTEADNAVAAILAMGDDEVIASATPDDLQSAIDTARQISRLTERAAIVALLRQDSATIRENANLYAEEAASDSRALHEVASTLLFKAHQIERGDHSFRSPMTAAQITAIIRAWLDAEDASHWGAFEKALDAAVETTNS